MAKHDHSKHEWVVLTASMQSKKGFVACGSPHLLVASDMVFSAGCSKKGGKKQNSAKNGSVKQSPWSVKEGDLIAVLDKSLDPEVHPKGV